MDRRWTGGSSTNSAMILQNGRSSGGSSSDWGILGGPGDDLAKPEKFWRIADGSATAIGDGRESSATNRNLRRRTGIFVDKRESSVTGGDLRRRTGIFGDEWESPATGENPRRRAVGASARTDTLCGILRPGRESLASSRKRRPGVGDGPRWDSLATGWIQAGVVQCFGRDLRSTACSGAPGQRRESPAANGNLRSGGICRLRAGIFGQARNRRLRAGNSVSA